MKIKWMMVLILAVGLVTGCSKDKEESKQESDKKEEMIVEATQEFTNHYPLSGIGTDESVNQRAVAVMVNNHPKARPQTGLKKADIVFELLAEGDVTRFVAIFQSEYPEKVGPVRSARDYYVRLAKGYDSLYIFHGWSPDAKSMIENGDVDNLNGLVYDGTLFRRASDRKAPHNSYITFENIQKGAEKRQYNMERPPGAYQFLTEEEATHINGEEVKGVKVSYSSPAFDATYEYDGTLGKYIRYTDGVRTEDSQSKEPVLLDNIMIVEAKHSVIDSAGRRAIDLESGGRAYLLQKGKRNEIQWENKEGRIVPMDGENEVKLVQGKTWINVIPTSPGLTDSVEILLSSQ